MIFEFENFDSITDWVATLPAVITGLNDHEQYIAGDLTHSLILNFDGIGCSCKKIYTTPIDVTNYKKLTFHIFSQMLRKNKYRTKDDFDYQINFGVAKSYYLSAPETFCDITIDISDLTSIEYIEIVALKADRDYLILSYGVLSIDEMPLDIFIGIKKAIDRELTAYLTSYPIGTITCSAGDMSLSFVTGNPFIDRYTPIYILDGIDSETHLIKEVNGLTVKFASVFDGLAMNHTHLAKPVYLAFPVVYGKIQSEIFLPSVAIWGVLPEELKIDNNLDHYIDAYKIAGTFKEKKVGRYYSYEMIIDCEARTYEVLTLISIATRNAVSKYQIWVNGRKINIDFSGVPVEIYPTDSVEIIPKIQYTIKVEIREDIYLSSGLVKSLPATITVEIV